MTDKKIFLVPEKLSLEERLHERILKNIKKRKVCFWCGKPYEFLCWQYYNINSKNIDKHDGCKWCSNKCMEQALKSKTIVNNIHRGKFHIHHGNNDCFGEFSP